MTLINVYVQILKYDLAINIEYTMDNLQSYQYQLRFMRDMAVLLANIR